MLQALVQACRTSLRASCKRTAAATSTGAATLQRRWASSADGPSEKESEIAQRLREQLPGARDIKVIDTSGGCGSMYQLHVTADEFRDLNIVKQHQLVARLLKEEIAQWHGFTLQTQAP
mmetsp:Transcript_10928/g.32754  ORF Transcript_10928/g.32754 Transcript_10928/m.32754 type:complete len:119 (-) Transcript_10928:1278-1634(-)